MKTIEIVGRETAYKGWLTFSILSIRLADGRVMRREVVEHGRAAAVLAYDAERRTAMLVRQARVPVYLASGEQLLLEAIAGMIDRATLPRRRGGKRWKKRDCNWARSNQSPRHGRALAC